MLLGEALSSASFLTSLNLTFFTVFPETIFTKRDDYQKLVKTAKISSLESYSELAPLLIPKEHYSPMICWVLSKDHMACAAGDAAAIANAGGEGERLNLVNNRAMNSRFYMISSTSQPHLSSSQYKREPEVNF